jgi:hypothetical protein
MVFFDIAAQWHMLYALYVDMKVQCDGTCAGEAKATSADTNCYLGQWIEGQGSKFAHLPSYQTADSMTKCKK